ncbi:hypothetical protein [Zavarzinia aquatilis]|uniref:Uncharacterized protein n=1 Tax=Zavarzinia aquatilis TaxID=2211142 RepID=A0A317E965_9PROT|nr:hypothetical protein [Zavarzinia aquatilis]PWR22750.1 hypothetical protein DKG74_09950 [Zavarzinia aquatilis]
MSFAGLMTRIGDRAAAVVEARAEALAGKLGGEVEGAGETRRITLSARALAREFGTAAQGARPRLSEAMAGTDLAGAMAAALKEAIADDT